ncbi:MAG: lipopolysaccharide ABC transporter ATP-binding protein, partial [Desulfobacterales bacterium]|nr:lipopolysaccharide ABC transporter ATP-binding protein [Desulfobacterales bacterium]
IIRQLRNRGIGIIISDHNVRETLNICDCAYIINEGRIIESGSPQEIIQSKIAREVYLGNAFNL